MTILRNLFFSGHRKAQREVEDADGGHAARLVTIPDQEDRLAIQDLEAALAEQEQFLAAELAREETGQ